jgi:hypothetical protein
VTRAVSKTAESSVPPLSKATKGRADYEPGPIENSAQEKHIAKPKTGLEASPVHPSDNERPTRSRKRPVLTKSPAKNTQQRLPAESDKLEKSKKVANPLDLAKVGHQLNREPQELVAPQAPNRQGKSSNNEGPRKNKLRHRNSLETRTQDQTKLESRSALAPPRVAPDNHESDLVAAKRDQEPSSPEVAPYTARIAAVGTTHIPHKIASPEISALPPVEFAVPVPEPQIQQILIEKPVHSRHQQTGTRVHIGQINVIVEATTPSSRQTDQAASSPPSGSSILLRGV